MLDQTKRNWLENQKKRIEFCILAGCWSGINHQTYISWLHNFPDEEGQYYALRLLYRFIYYSESDTAQLCKHGLLNLLLGEELLKEQISSDFSNTSKELKHNLDQALKSSRIVPLLDKDKPYESGYFVTRILAQRLQIPSSIIINPKEIFEEIYKGCTRIIIIDDCVGSGDQITSFWTRSQFSVGRYTTSLYEMAEKYPKVDFHYLTLVGVDSGIQEAEQALSRLQITACETLTEEHRVFSTNSHFFTSEDEKNEAIVYLNNLLSSQRINLKGHASLDYAVAFHHNIPDWTLPLFHKNRTHWKPLIFRKDSDA